MCFEFFIWGLEIRLERQVVTLLIFCVSSEMLIYLKSSRADSPALWWASNFTKLTFCKETEVSLGMVQAGGSEFRISWCGTHFFSVFHLGCWGAVSVTVAFSVQRSEGKKELQKAVWHVRRQVSS